MNEQLSFESWLRERRKELDLTQLDLADRVGCSEDTLQKIETGARRPSRQIAQRLAECLRIPPDEQEAFVAAAREGKEPTFGVASAAPTAYHSAGRALPDRTSLTNPTNLPTPLTPLVGREQTVADARSYLLGGVRLLTLTGAPGIGKTRLSLQVASSLRGDFPGGVFLVELAPISDPDLVAPTIASALGLQEMKGQPILEVLKRYLGGNDSAGNRLLLLLDNFEQVLDGAPVVVQLLSACPQLKGLVTSREALHVIGEQQMPVPPLEVPDLSHLPDPEGLEGYPAVELFVQRASAANPGFRLTRENSRDVAVICARLEGLPLAIELAAARIKFFPPHSLLTRLDSWLKTLTGGARALPQRQQTLRNAIEWSYDLLSEEEKRLFRRLAVFLGGCTVEAVEMVCNPDGSVGVDMLEGLISLIDKSLLRQSEGVGGEPRFMMLEMIHEYGRDKLLESGEQDVVKRRHAQYFAEVAEAAELKVWGPKEKRMLDRLEEEHDNMRAALQWSHSTGGDVEIELRLVVALGRFWEFRGYLSEGRERLAAALSKPESKAERVKLLRAWALTQTNQLAFWQADYPAARSALEEAITLFRELGDRQGLARAVTDMWDVLTGEGDYEKSLVVATESLEINRSLADAQGTVISLVTLGWSEMYLGNYTRAAPHMEEAVALARKIDVPHRTALAVSALGELRVRQGKYEQALLLLEEGLAIRRRIGHRSYIAATLGTIALAALRQNDYERATELLVESLGMRKELGDRGGVAWCLEKFAQIESAVGDAERAARLLGAAQAMREMVGTEVDLIDRDKYDQVRSAVLDRLGEGVLLERWKEGHSMSMEEAVEYATGERADA